MMAGMCEGRKERLVERRAPAGVGQEGRKEKIEVYVRSTVLVLTTAVKGRVGR